MRSAVIWINQIWPNDIVPSVYTHVYIPRTKIRTYVYTYIYIYMYMCMCMENCHLNKSDLTQWYSPICIYTRIYITCKNTYIRTYVYIYICKCVCTWKTVILINQIWPNDIVPSVYTHVYISHTKIRTYVYTYIYIYVNVYVHGKLSSE